MPDNTERLRILGERSVIEYLQSEYPIDYVFHVVAPGTSPLSPNYIVSLELQRAGIDVMVCKRLDTEDKYDESLAGSWISIHQADAKGREYRRWYRQDPYLELCMERPATINNVYCAIQHFDDSFIVRNISEEAIEPEPQDRSFYVPAQEGGGVVTIPYLSHGGPGVLGGEHSPNICDAVYFSFWDLNNDSVQKQFLINKWDFIDLVNTDDDFFKSFFVINNGRLRQVITRRGLEQIAQRQIDNYGRREWAARGILPINNRRRGGIDIAPSLELIENSTSHRSSTRQFFLVDNLPLFLVRPWALKPFSVTIYQDNYCIGTNSLLIRTGLLKRAIHRGVKVPLNIVTM